MNKIAYLTLFSLITTMLLSASVASAQNAGVRGDYDRYAKLFAAGKEPEFATDDSWRGAYSRNNWKGYADGTEFRDPLPEAQVLVGLYSLATIERKLNHQIGNIALQKGLLSKALADTIVLDQIVGLLEEDLVISDAELVGDFRGINFRRIKMEKLLRERITGPVPSNLRTEVTALQNLFRPERAGGWAAKYRVIREQISVLDTLAGSFTFNWSKERKEKEVNRLMEEAGFPREQAEEELEKMIAKHKAYKYIVGVYQGMDYHVRDLEQIYYYFLESAEQGNPLAQYHVALFLVYFGDILDMRKEDIEQKCREWLAKAYDSDLTHARVVETNAQLIAENDKKEKRIEDTGKKIETLIRLEHERMDMIDNTLIQMAKRTRRINDVQKRMIEEMERERERQAITQRDFFRAVAMAEAARLESMRPVIIMRQR